MLNYQSGEVILLAFVSPVAIEAKGRPGLVLRDTGDEDLVVARITNQPTRSAFDIEIVEWQKAGLLLPSVIQVHKINTLDKSLIKRRLGILSPIDWSQVCDRLRQLWSFS